MLSHGQNLHVFLTKAEMDLVTHANIKFTCGSDKGLEKKKRLKPCSCSKLDRGMNGALCPYSAFISSTKKVINLVLGKWPNILSTSYHILTYNYIHLGNQFACLLHLFRWPEITAWGCCQDGWQVARLAYKDFGITYIFTSKIKDHVMSIVCSSCLHYVWYIVTDLWFVFKQWCCTQNTVCKKWQFQHIVALIHSEASQSTYI